MRTIPPSITAATIAKRSPAPIELQIVGLAIIFLYATFFQLTRALGAAALLLAVGAAILVWLPMTRWYVQRWLVWYAVLAGIYVVLSFAGLLHWDTLLFDPGVIVQQSIYAFLLPVLVPIFAYYHERVVASDPAFVRLDNIVLIACIVSKLVYVATSQSLEGLGVIQLFNVEAIFTFLLVRRIYYTKSPSTLLRVLVVTVLAITAGSFQSTLATMFLVGVLIFPQFGRIALIYFVVGLIAISIAAIPFADAIWQTDPNTGIRLFFWHDAIERIVSSWGIGQGFGTETIRPIYRLSVKDVTIASLDEANFILVGSHNAFIDAGYRMGLVGMTVLVVYVGGLFHATGRVADGDRAFDYFICALLFILLMVNVGLASINFLFGAAFLMGWLAFRRAIDFADPRRLVPPAPAGSRHQTAAVPS